MAPEAAGWLHSRLHAAGSGHPSRVEPWPGWCGLLLSQDDYVIAREVSHLDPSNAAALVAFRYDPPAAGAVGGTELLGEVLCGMHSQPGAASLTLAASGTSLAAWCTIHYSPCRKLPQRLHPRTTCDLCLSMLQQPASHERPAERWRV